MNKKQKNQKVIASQIRQLSSLSKSQKKVYRKLSRWKQLTIEFPEAYRKRQK